MYADATSLSQTTLYQGDIIDDFPFFIFENSQQAKKNAAGYFELDNSDQDAAESLSVVPAKKQRVIILSQTCDVQRRKNIILCPVYDLGELIANGTISASNAGLLRKRSLYYWFYLPALGSFSESFADLQTMVYVPRDQITALINKRVSSLDDLGRHHLGWALANYFGRPVDDQRT